jgi:hypothetical protein
VLGKKQKIRTQQEDTDTSGNIIFKWTITEMSTGNIKKNVSGE